MKFVDLIFCIIVVLDFIRRQNSIGVVHQAFGIVDFMSMAFKRSKLIVNLMF